MGTVALEELEADDVEILRLLVQAHADLTRSKRAAEVLANWDQALSNFVKVMPVDYKRALAEAAQEGKSNG